MLTEYRDERGRRGTSSLGRGRGAAGSKVHRIFFHRFRIPRREASLPVVKVHRPVSAGLWGATRFKEIQIELKLARQSPAWVEGSVPSDLRYSGHNIGFHSPIACLAKEVTRTLATIRRSAGRAEPLVPLAGYRSRTTAWAILE